jgi:hypothetical protein
MKLAEKQKSRKLIKYAILAILLLTIVFFGVSKLLSNTASKTAPDLKKNRSTALNNQNNPAVWPKPPITCQGNISLVPLTSFYVISGLGCTTRYSSRPVISCDGNTFNYAVSLNCYKTTNYSYKDQLVCNGTVSTLNNTISYTCSIPDLSNTQIYSCSGSINITNPSAVSVPMFANCTS